MVIVMAGEYLPLKGFGTAAWCHMNEFVEVYNLI